MRLVAQLTFPNTHRLGRSVPTSATRLKPSIPYSQLFLICCVFFMVGCAKKPIDPFAATHTVQSLISAHGMISSKSDLDYFGALINRLAKPLEPKPKIQFTLLVSPEPFAAGVGSEYLVFSTGLVTTVQNESELAFVLAHELAHIFLKHAENANEEDSEKNELSADELGLRLLSFAGYNPQSALDALRRLGSGHYDPSVNTTHPTSAARIQHLTKAVRILAMSQVPVVTESRTYRHIQERMASVTGE
jgi:predicted Zn-dependent protease